MATITITYDSDKDDIIIDKEGAMLGNVEVYRGIGDLVRMYAKMCLTYDNVNPEDTFSFSEDITKIDAWMCAFIRMTNVWAGLKFLLSKEKTIEQEDFQDNLMRNSFLSIIVSVLRKDALKKDVLKHEITGDVSALPDTINKYVRAKDQD